MLGQPLGQLDGAAADRQVNHQARRIRRRRSRRQIAQYDFVSRPPDFREFVQIGDGLRCVFTPDLALLFEIGLRTAIDIRCEASGKIKRFQDHRNGIARGADQCEDRGQHTDNQRQ